MDVDELVKKVDACKLKLRENQKKLLEFQEAINVDNISLQRAMKKYNLMIDIVKQTAEDPDFLEEYKTIKTAVSEDNIAK